jgi:DNA-binding MarR family transcriptional regulator
MAPKVDINHWSKATLFRLGEALRLLPGEIGLPQLLALVAIASEPGLSVGELADRLGLPQQTASRHVAVLSGRYQGMLSPFDIDNPRPLKTQSLIVQEVSESNPRRHALYISGEGRALLEAVASRLDPQADDDTKGRS